MPNAISKEKIEAIKEMWPRSRSITEISRATGINHVTIRRYSKILNLPPLPTALRRWTAKEVRDCVDRYHRGERPSSIALVHNCSLQTVIAIIFRRTSKRQFPQAKITPAICRKVKELVADNWPQRKIAKMIGISERKVSKIIKENGLRRPLTKGERFVILNHRRGYNVAELRRENTRKKNVALGWPYPVSDAQAKIMQAILDNQMAGLPPLSTAGVTLAVGYAKDGASDDLRDLARLGFVIRHKIGNAYQYTLPEVIADSRKRVMGIPIEY